jgi:hypothetical protein
MFTNMQSEIRALQTAPRLGMSSLEGGAIAIYDENGNLVAVVGRQEDGTNGAVTLDGPVPPRPVAPRVEGGPAQLTITWNGQVLDDETGEVRPLPLDFQAVEVFVREPGQEWDLYNPVGVIASEAGGQKVVVVLPGAQQVALRTRATSGRTSALSDVVTAVALSGPATEEKIAAVRKEIDDAIQAVDQKAGEAFQKGTDAAAKADTAAGAASTAQEAADKANAAAAALVAQAENKTTNWSFEQGMDGWTATGGTTEVVDSTTAADGGRVARMTSNTTADARLVPATANFAAAAGGQAWLFRARVRAVGSVPVTGNVTLAYSRRTAAGGSSSASLVHVGAGQTLALSTDWIPVEAMVTVPEGTTKVAPYLIARTTLPEGTLIEWDAVEMRDVTQAKAALDAAAAAQARADEAHKLAGTANENAQLAVASANGKNALMRSTAAPSGTGKVVGDVWWRFKDDTWRVVIGQWVWSGTEWVEAGLNHEVISSVDIGTLTVVGQATLASAVIETLWAQVVMSRKIIADQVLVGQGPNMIPWTPAAGVEPHERFGSSTVGNTKDADLGWCLYVRGGGGTDGTLQSNLRLTSGKSAARNGRAGAFDVDAGKVYRVRVGLGVGGTTPAGITRQARVFTQYHDGTGTLLGQTAPAAITVSAFGAEIPYYEFQAPVPAGAVSMDIYVQKNFFSSGDLFVVNPSLTLATDSSLIVDGAVTAKALEAELALLTKIIAGAPNGTHAEMSPSGFRVFKDDPIDGVPDEVVRLGVADTNDYFAVTDSAGEVLATIDEAGDATFQDLNVPGTITLAGEDLATLLDQHPYGTLAKVTLAGDVVVGSTAGRLLAANFQIPGDGDRQIRLNISVAIERQSNGDEIPVAIDLKMNATGTVVSGNTTQKTFDAQTDSAANRTFTTSYEFRSTELGVTDFLSVGIWARTATGRNVRILSSGSSRVPNAETSITVEDLGPGVPTGRQTGTSTEQSGSADGSGTVGKTTRTKTVDAAWTANYKAGGALHATNEGRAHQGYNSANPRRMSQIGFPSLAADLSGATINWIEVYVYFAHWWNNAGGTAVIGVHRNGSAPSTYSNQTDDVVRKAIKKPGGAWVRLPSSTFAGWLSGSWRGITLRAPGDSTSTTYYGYATIAKLRVNYTK